LDIRITKDKKAVIFHDPDLSRMANDCNTISDYNYDELPTLSSETYMHFSHDQKYIVKNGLDSQKIPLLEVNLIVTNKKGFI